MQGFFGPHATCKGAFKRHARHVLHAHEGHHHGHGHGRHAGAPGHRGFHGFGRGDGFPGDRSGGGGGLGPGRKLGSVDLQLLILALLAEQPRHGYEIIKALAERSNGYYSPSPGMVYPALTYLEELGLASVESEGSRKRYSITVAGLAHLDEHRGVADTLLQQLDWIGQKMERVRAAFGADASAAVHDDTDSAADPFATRRGGRSGVGAALHQAMHALRDTLRDLRGASPDEQRRIAAILQRAVDDIRSAGTAR